MIIDDTAKNGVRTESVQPVSELLDLLVAACTKQSGAAVPGQKLPISLSLSPDVVSYFKSMGPGWHEQIDDILREAAGLATASAGRPVTDG